MVYNGFLVEVDAAKGVGRLVSVSTGKVKLVLKMKRCLGTLHSRLVRAAYRSASN